MRDSDSCPIPLPSLVAAFLFVAVFGVGSALWAVVIRPSVATDAQIALHGRDVTGTVITDGSGNHGVCTLNYEVNGTAYDEDADCHSRAGSSVVVRYDPSAPQRSYVERLPPSNGYPLLGIALAAAGFSFTGWSGTRQILRRLRNR